MLDFHEKNLTKKIGFGTGFVFSFVLFSIVLYFILTLLGRLPVSWGYAHVFMISISIFCIGTFIKLLQK